MTEFEFDPAAAARIEAVVQHYPLSLKHCADLLEIVAPLAGVLTESGACHFLQRVVDVRCSDDAPLLLKALRDTEADLKIWEVTTNSRDTVHRA